MAEDLPGADSFRQNQRLRIFILGAFFLGVFLLALGAGLLVFRNSPSDDIQIISDHSNQSIDQSEVVVHVDGAVKSPGVYKLAADSRIADALAAAGGLAQNADSKNVNLAARISDGQKVYVFAKGENTGTTSIKGTTSTTGFLININTDSQSQLESLPGIGPVTAQKIIALRPYSGLEDLLTKKVVSRSVFEKIKDLITL